MTTFLRELLIIVALTILGAAFSLFSGLAPLPWEKPSLAPGEIEITAVRALEVLWVDARSQEDYNKEHIPRAILLNEDNWEDGIVDLMNAWLTNLRPIIVYCSSDRCNTSQHIAARLREALPNAEIYSLKGGWDAWIR